MDTAIALTPCINICGTGQDNASEAGVQFPALPQVGKLVFACRLSAVYSTEPWPTVCTGFLCPSNYPPWYDLYSVKSDIKPQINK